MGCEICSWIHCSKSPSTDLDKAFGKMMNSTSPKLMAEFLRVEESEVKELGVFDFSMFIKIKNCLIQKNPEMEIEVEKNKITTLFEIARVCILENPLYTSFIHALQRSAGYTSCFEK